MSTSLNIATVQCLAIQGHPNKVVSLICKTLEQAEAENIDIICFPECYLQGYYHDKESIRKNAISLSSVEFASVLDRLKHYRPTIILGLIEERRGKILNTAVVIEKGKVIGSYNKVHLNETKYTAGKRCPVFRKNNITYGINICNDANYPDSARKLMSKGAQVIFYPLNNLLPIKVADEWRTKGIETMIERAKENNCWVISSDVIYRGKEQKSYGCTAIVDPNGKVIKRVPEFKEGLISHSIVI